MKLKINEGLYDSATKFKIVYEYENKELSEIILADSIFKAIELFQEKNPDLEIKEIINYSKLDESASRNRELEDIAERGHINEIKN